METMRTVEMITTPRKIFVVDNEPAIADTLGFILRHAGFEIETFYDGQQAVEHLMMFGPPDLIVTDIMMPALDGISLAKRILEQSPTCKILFLSSELRLSASIRHFGPHMAQIDALEKPVPPHEIVTKIGQLLQPQPPLHDRLSRAEVQSCA
jgi:two-component system OmpR family response regulator